MINSISFTLFYYILIINLFSISWIWKKKFKNKTHSQIRFLIKKIMKNFKKKSKKMNKLLNNLKLMT